ncbi:DUF2333 family protein [Methyloceanibacter sp.]|jgi:hypothetical protein|uniref:DUF2333 family protein n=1 Tax=Methyloceanibacter sp. TaxID=1965321 RepID=UPI00356780DE
MLNSIVNFFTATFRAIGRGIGLGIAFMLRPFVWLGRWFAQRGILLKVLLGLILVGFLALYGYFFWNTQVWSGFDTNYADRYEHTSDTGLSNAKPSGGGIITGESETQDAETATQTCRKSMVVESTADLVDFNVNENAWISSMLLYKLGLFGLPWESTPFFDNKAAFQRGVHQAVRRTAIELVDTLGRVRGTSQIDKDLQSARGALQFDETTWYFSFSPFGPKTPTPSFYRSAIKDLHKFNDRLKKCEAVFDVRADNLLQFVDRIAKDIGATSAILRERSENYSSGWFDPRADDRFWFAYGQLYAYYGILTAARTDFADVIEERRLTALWDELEEQLRASLRIQPAIISNGAEDGWLMPSHLATLGFYVLRVRSNLVEVRLVLDR